MLLTPLAIRGVSPTLGGILASWSSEGSKVAFIESLRSAIGTLTF